MQLDEKIGPNVINVSRCMIDIATIAVAYFIICLAYSCGIVYILKVNRDVHQFSKDNEDKKTPVSFNATFKALFWQMVDTGRKSEAIPNEGILGEFTYVIYFTYNLLIVIVLLNLLIAIMNSTVSRLEERRLLYWKYTRTGIWIEHFDDSMELPLPYAPLHIFKAIVILFKKLKKLKPTESVKENCNFSEDQLQMRLVYIELLKCLSRRMEENENDRKNESKNQRQSTAELKEYERKEMERKRSFIQHSQDTRRRQSETEI